ncbi:hypothetical protein EV659_108107 [Rhodothalassium salexigens DSM 2132]|uniref:Phosphoribosyltransferase domain-containing protein n=1 Tax=Rhodothalassium salexigens DSM 2132 TaxID=1188247 RepID=A0A4R2PEW3_RHOSA|nr:phosphoribosyltransferase family protein [Rhodothalassium salexigens]MBB4212134.1 hypothetical protein [Rhodothalassium salexigens DSM 2132]MBK1638198.1 hypoxanthine phosphoribosyltransferase [Rhodothalassium salexigens DSM 2132]TCP33008.1 hypothetical protein EV659_108107 [Rhodothalassium salexigens DSM 2132]
MSKVFISAEDLLRDSFELAMRILESGYRPSFIVGVWRGGAPVGIAVQEVFEYVGIETDHIAIRTASYGGGTEPSHEVQVYGLDHLVETINYDDQLLIVDDVFDSGRSVRAVIEELRRRCRRNAPREIKVATVYYKPLKNRTDRVPDYFIHETEQWLVFPHEMRGCTTEELRAHKALPKRFYDWDGPSGD